MILYIYIVAFYLFSNFHFNWINVFNNHDKEHKAYFTRSDVCYFSI